MAEKKRISDLALFGGKPLFDEQLYVGRPNIPDRKRLLQRINECLDKRWLTTKGPYVLELEKRIADYLGVKHCIAICNGTIALQIAIKALDLNGEVIVPSFMFISTAHALQWLGIKPVFCDLDPKTHNIDPLQIEELITNKTSGIIGVHLWGRPCDIDALSKIAHNHNLQLIFDAAHAFGASAQGRMIGQFGHAEIFSFHATKFFNTLEGGAIVTNDDALNQKLRLMKNFGFKGFDNVVSIGINGKMNEISAAVGLGMMEGLEELIGLNRSLYHTYRRELEGLRGVRLLEYNEEEKCNYQSIVSEIDEQLTGIGRDRVVTILHAENIIARRYFYPGCHRMEPYHLDPFFQKHPLPHTERVSQRILCLPTGSTVDEEAVRRICGLLRFIFRCAEEISATLA